MYNLLTVDHACLCEDIGRIVLFFGATGTRCITCKTLVELNDGTMKCSVVKCFLSAGEVSEWEQRGCGKFDTWITVS